MKSGLTSNVIGLHKYEMHINIAHKLFRICSLNYQNVQELEDKMKFNDSTEYYFAIWISNINDSVTVHKI